MISLFLNYSLFAYTKQIVQKREISLEDVNLIGYDNVKQN